MTERPGGGPEQLRARFAELIRRERVPLPDELITAFASVPREMFVPGGFRHHGGWLRPGDPGFLEAVYADEVLVTSWTATGRSARPASRR